MFGDALKEYKGTVLFVSHDRFFINALANKVLNIEDCKTNHIIETTMTLKN